MGLNAPNPRPFRTLALLVAASLSVVAHAQVFTVGEKSATADIKTDFTPTKVELPDGHLSERGRRELVRDFDAEQGFAHRVLPLGGLLTLEANGNLTPGDEQYKQMVYKKGSAASPGDRVVVTRLEFKGDRIDIDVNGGPYVKHRFLRHVQVGVGPLTSADPDLSEQATGCRVTLVFEGGIPEISAPEIKALLQPVIDFGVKTGEQAYADTLPDAIRSAIASHELLVGMNHRMVLASLGQPESKLRESGENGRYEEWIYGHQPQTMRFVRFQGDRVSLIKVAALGKAVELRDQDEMGGYVLPQPTRTLAQGDVPTTEQGGGAPSLKLPGEKSAPVESDATSGGGQVNRKVQYPIERKPAAEPAPEETPAPKT